MKWPLAALALFATLGSGAVADSGWIPSRKIDLLALIDIKQDSVRGEWTLENGVLSSTRKEPDYGLSELSTSAGRRG